MSVLEEGPLLCCTSWVFSQCFSWVFPYWTPKVSRKRASRVRWQLNASHPVIAGLAARSLTPSVHMLKCSSATPKCSRWLGQGLAVVCVCVNERHIVKMLWIKVIYKCIPSICCTDCNNCVTLLNAHQGNEKCSCTVWTKLNMFKGVNAPYIMGTHCRTRNLRVHRL